MAFQNIKMQNFLGQHAPTTPLQFESLVLVRFISDWKISQFYLLKRLESVSFLFTLCLTQFLKARDFGWIHLQRNSHSHHIILLTGICQIKRTKNPTGKSDGHTSLKSQECLWSWSFLTWFITYVSSKTCNCLQIQKRESLKAGMSQQAVHCK